MIALHNPYDPNERKGLKWGDYPGDVSLYRGKYYLYLGPAPALILLAVKPLDYRRNWRPIRNIHIRCRNIDPTVTAGNTILELFFFRSASLDYIVMYSICWAGVPIHMDTKPGKYLYYSKRRWPILFSCRAIPCLHRAGSRTSISEVWLFAAGISFAFAVGSRLTQILPISFVVLMAASFTLWKYRQAKLFSKALYATASLGLPLVLGLGILGWYNWARFICSLRQVFTIN